MIFDNKDYKRLMDIRNNIDPDQFIHFATRYMRKNDTSRMDHVCSRNGKPVEEIKITRRTHLNDEES